MSNMNHPPLADLKMAEKIAQLEKRNKEAAKEQLMRIQLILDRMNAGVRNNGK